MHLQGLLWIFGLFYNAGASALGYLRGYPLVGKSNYHSCLNLGKTGMIYKAVWNTESHSEYEHQDVRRGLAPDLLVMSAPKCPKPQGSKGRAFLPFHTIYKHGHYEY
jgi:hypothetical protein